MNLVIDLESYDIAQRHAYARLTAHIQRISTMINDQSISELSNDRQRRAVAIRVPCALVKTTEGEIVPLQPSNFLSPTWCEDLPDFTLLDPITAVSAICSIYTLPRYNIDDDEYLRNYTTESEGLNFLSDCMHDCKQRKTSAPLMLFATHILDLPPAYVDIIYRVFVRTLNGSNTCGVARQAIYLIGELIDHLRFSNRNEPLSKFSPLFRNGNLDDEDDEPKFVLHGIGIVRELEVVVNNTCLRCTELSYECTHQVRLIDILHALPDDVILKSTIDPIHYHS